MWTRFSMMVLFLVVRGSDASVLDLGNMLRLMTSRNPLDFVNYGNWCGLGGSGYPLDDIDRCCKMHDLCYDKVSESNCLHEKPHIAPYKWKYATGKIHCNKRDDPCGLSSCRCDGKFAACAQIYQSSYDSRKKRTRTPLLSLLTNTFIQIDTNKK